MPKKTGGGEQAEDRHIPQQVSSRRCPEARRLPQCQEYCNHRKHILYLLKGGNLPRSVSSIIRAAFPPNAARAACPRLMPPSLGGTAWLVRIARGPPLSTSRTSDNSKLVLENAAGENDRIEVAARRRERIYRCRTTLERLHAERPALFPVACGRVFGLRRRPAAAGENPARRRQREKDSASGPSLCEPKPPATSQLVLRK